MDKIKDQLKVLWEVVKDLGRWIISYLMVEIFNQVLALITKAPFDPTVKLLLTGAVKYLDYAWHKYHKKMEPEGGKSQGIIPF